MKWLELLNIKSATSKSPKMDARSHCAGATGQTRVCTIQARKRLSTGSYPRQGRFTPHCDSDPNDQNDKSAPRELPTQHGCSGACPGYERRRSAEIVQAPAGKHLSEFRRGHNSIQCGKRLQIHVFLKLLLVLHPLRITAGQLAGPERGPAMAASFETQPGSSEVATEDGEELLSEELEAVSAAYPEAARWIHARRVLSVELPALTLRLHVPAGYPTEPPSATMDTRVGVTVTEVDELKAELQDTISMADGDMVLLPCIAVAEGASQEWQEAHSSAPEAVEAAAPATTEAQRAGTCVSSVPCPPIVHGDPVVERKSTVRAPQVISAPRLQMHAPPPLHCHSF